MRRRIVAVMEAGDAYPSGFIRALIYRDWFASGGYAVRFTSRLHPGLRKIVEAPPALLRPFVRGPASRIVFALERVLGYFRELRIVRMARSADVVYMSKITSLRLVRNLRRRTNARLVLDFGDALWLPNRRVAGFDEILGLVDAVTTDNELTAAYARTRTPLCVVIPDSPQIEWFDRRRREVAPRTDGRIVIGWVGTPGTTYNLWIVWEALERLFKRHSHLELRLLGADPSGLPPFESVRWSLKHRYGQADMIDEVLGMDIGLFPLQDVEACRVRGVLKATVYMSGRVPVVASPVGQSCNLIVPDQTGLLASTIEEWEGALERLIGDPSLRARLADNGLETVRRDFTVARAFEKLRAVLDPPGAEIRTS